MIVNITELETILKGLDMPNEKQKVLLECLTPFIEFHHYIKERYELSNEGAELLFQLYLKKECEKLDPYKESYYVDCAQVLKTFALLHFYDVDKTETLIEKFLFLLENM
jgi:hypothetical protein